MGSHEPIVTQEVFDTVQRVLSGRKLSSAPKRKHNPAFPLKHFVKCGNCGIPLTGGMNKGKLKHYAHYWCRNPHCNKRVSVSKALLEADFLEHLQMLRPDEVTIAQFPAIASRVWARRHTDKNTAIERLNQSLSQLEKLKTELLRAKLRGEVSQVDYALGNSEFDEEIANIKQQLETVRSRHRTLDAFLRFSKLMLVDIASAWRRAPIEQRVSVQNFLFHDGIAYTEETKFLNTAKPTLFQQLRELASFDGRIGVPDGI